MPVMGRRRTDEVDYLNAWSDIAVYTAAHDAAKVDEVIAKHGVKRQSIIASVPGTRGRFASLFPQDAMHDLFIHGPLEHVAAKFIYAVVHANHLTLDEFNSRLAAYARRRKWRSKTPDLPTITADKLEALKVNGYGTHVYMCLHARVRAACGWSRRCICLLVYARAY
jgi:hypothetical protein